MSDPKEVVRSREWLRHNLEEDWSRDVLGQDIYKLNASPPDKIALAYYDDGTARFFVDGVAREPFAADTLNSVSLMTWPQWRGIDDVAKAHYVRIAEPPYGRRFAEWMGFDYRNLKIGTRASRPEWWVFAAIFSAVGAAVALGTFGAIIYSLHVLFPAYGSWGAGYEPVRVNPMLSEWWRRHGLSGGASFAIWLAICVGALGLGIYVAGRLTAPLFAKVREAYALLNYSRSSYRLVIAHMNGGETLRLAATYGDIDTIRAAQADFLATLTAGRSLGSARARAAMPSSSGEGFDL